MQLNDQFSEVIKVIKCVSCYREIDDQPVVHNDEWYHAVCYAESRKRQQYARELAARFDFHALLYKRW